MRGRTSTPLEKIFLDCFPDELLDFIGACFTFLGNAPFFSLTDTTDASFDLVVVAIVFSCRNKEPMTMLGQVPTDTAGDTSYFFANDTKGESETLLLHS